MIDEIPGRVGEGLPRPVKGHRLRHPAPLDREIVAAVEGRDDQPARDVAIGPGERLPELRAAKGMDRANPHLAATAPLRHALRRLQAMEVVAVDTAVTHADALEERHVERHVDRRLANRDWQRRAGQERKAEATGIGDHLGALVPLGGEVLVVEHRHRPARVFEHLDAFLEPLVARIARLPLVVLRVVAMLGDDHDAVDGELVGAEGERFADSGEIAEAVAGDPLPAEVGLLLFAIPLRELRDVDRRHVEPRLLPAPLPGIAAAEAVEDVLRVGVLEDHRAEDGDLFSSTRGDGVRRHE